MTDSAREYLGEEVLLALRRPDLSTARGLPARVYTDPQFFELEQRRLFPRSWMGIGFDCDVPEPGDAVPMEVFGLPLVLTRDQSGQIHVLHNVCRHRATIVVERPCAGARTLKCPYHGWVYGLDGSLKATPFWDGTADSRRCPVGEADNGLTPVRSAVWNHVVFVNLSGDAPPLPEYLAPMQAELDHLALDELEPAHAQSWSFEANWKLVMENWEVYHHVWVHHGVFDRMSDEVDIETGKPHSQAVANGNAMILRYLPSRPSRSAGMAIERLPTLPQRSSPNGPVGVANAVLPNTTVTVGPKSYVPAVYLPISPGVTEARMAWFFAPGAASGPGFEAGRSEILDRWLGPSRRFEDGQGIRPQDHRCMELQQRARVSPVADDVKFSPTWESCVRYFQDWLVRRIDT